MTRHQLDAALAWKAFQRVVCPTCGVPAEPDPSMDAWECFRCQQRWSHEFVASIPNWWLAEPWLWRRERRRLADPDQLSLPI